MAVFPLRHEGVNNPLRGSGDDSLVTGESVLVRKWSNVELRPDFLSDLLAKLLSDYENLLPENAAERFDVDLNNRLIDPLFGTRNSRIDQRKPAFLVPVLGHATPSGFRSPVSPFTCLMAL